MKRENDITFLISSLNAGGAEKVAVLVMNELVKRNWKVTLLMTKLEGPYLNILDSKVEIVLLPHRNISKNVYEISKYLKKNKPTVFYSSMMYINVVAGWSAKLANYKGKLVFSEHSHPSAVLKTQGSLLVKLVFKLAQWIYPRAAAIICVSDGIKEDLNKIFKKLPKLVVINNPIEINDYNHPNLENDLFRIVSVGRLHKDKNFEVLINTFKNILNHNQDKKFELIILGEGSHRSQLETLIKNLDLEKKVILKGFVENPTEFVNDCNLFVFPSNREGFGNVLVEALSTGIPIVSSDCKSGPAEILDNGRYGSLFPVDDSSALYTAIQNEVNQPTRLNDSLISQRKQRAKDFRVETIVDEYVKVFKM